MKMFWFSPRKGYSLHYVRGFNIDEETQNRNGNTWYNFHLDLFVFCTAETSDSPLANYIHTLPYVNVQRSYKMLWKTSTEVCIAVIWWKINIFEHLKKENNSEFRMQSVGEGIGAEGGAGML